MARMCREHRSPSGSPPARPEVGVRGPASRGPVRPTAVAQVGRGRVVPSVHTQEAPIARGKELPAARAAQAAPVLIHGGQQPGPALLARLGPVGASARENLTGEGAASASTVVAPAAMPWGAASLRPRVETRIISRTA